MPGSLSVQDVNLMATPGRREAFGRALRDARKRLNLTQDQATDLLRAKGEDLTKGAWSGYELGTYAPDVDRVRVMEDVLGCPGELVPLLGLPADVPPPDPTDVMTRLARIERELVDQREERREQSEIAHRIWEAIKRLEAGDGPR